MLVIIPTWPCFLRTRLKFKQSIVVDICSLFCRMWLISTFGERQMIKQSIYIACPSSLACACVFCFHVCLLQNSRLVLVYCIYPCISRQLILEPKNKFFLFLGKNFLEKLIFYLRIFFQGSYCYMKKICPELFFISVFDPIVKVEGNFLDQFLGCKRMTYTQVNTVLILPKIPLSLFFLSTCIFLRLLFDANSPACQHGIIT